MKSSKLKLFLGVTVESILITVIWVPNYFLRCILVQFVTRFLSNYGKILDHCAVCLEEDYTQAPPKNAMVFTLALDGHLKTAELKQLFTNKVLQARIPNTEKLRYPEFKQYQVFLAGYKFWHNDPNFQIHNHIIEESSFRDYSSLSAIHQEMLIKPFKKYRSPWKIKLIQNYKIGESLKTVLVLRVHHTLGDTKSMLKVLVECLGDKQLKLPHIQKDKETSSLTTSLERIKYYILLPFYFILVQVRDAEISSEIRDTHPWRWLSEEKQPPLNVGVSGAISMAEIKSVAQQNNIRSSAVIMSIICDAIRKVDLRFEKEGIPCRYVLPKSNHPAIFANHYYSTLMVLPTNEPSRTKLLQKCNEVFSEIRFSHCHLHKYSETVKFQRGTLSRGIREILKEDSVPLLITNIAADMEGFKIGSCV